MGLRTLALCLLLASPALGQITLQNVTIADASINVDAGVSDCGDVADLLAWYDATTGVSEGATFTWADQSGNGNDVTQSTAIYQPAVSTSCQNSLDCINFDDDLTEVDFLQGSEWGLDVNTTGVTIFIIFDNLSGVLSSDNLLGQQAGTGSSRNFVTFTTSPDPREVRSYLGGGVHDGTSAIAANTTYLAILALGSGSSANMDIYVNGGSDENSDTDTGLASNGDMVVGASHTTTTSDPHYIMEICVYDTVLSQANREAVRDALNTKWSIY